MKKKSIKGGLAIVVAVMMAFTLLTVGKTSFVARAAEFSISESSGWFESAYVKCSLVSGAKGYKAYIKAANEGDSAYKQIDNELIRIYKNYVRVDAVGLKAGNYVIKVEAILSSGTVTVTSESLTVSPYDRSGFAFSSDSKYKTGSGAYNDDGTLKSNAQVVYVSAETAKTCTATVDGVKVTGIQAILDAKIKGDTTPIAVRIIGCVTLSDLDKISSSKEGIQIKGRNNYAEMNVTIEGIGDDAAASGFGFLVRNAGNVEFRNFSLLNFMDDGISLDTANCNVWIHNVDLYYGSAGGDSDQAKGDGSIDMKGNSQYLTVSYVHFYDSGKSSLCGMTSESGPNYITYHHNWFDHSDSRHPRIRTMSVHIYNNYYDGNAKYGVGVTMGSSAFVEANYFRNCANPMLSSKQGTDAKGQGTFSGENGGIIKAFANEIIGGQPVIYANTADGNQTDFDAYLASSRDEKVPNTYKTVAGSTTYDNFDTTVDLGVKASNVDAAKDVPQKVKANAGSQGGGVVPWIFDASEDTNYAVIPELKAAVTNYKNTELVSVGGMNGSTGEDNTTSGQNETTKGEEVTTGSGEVTGSYLHNFTESGKNSNVYTIVGNLSKDKGTVTYDGKTLTQCLKMESSTNIKFTAPSDGKLILVFGGSTSAAGKGVKVNGIKYTCDNNSIAEIDVKAGAVEIIKADSINLFLINGIFSSTKPSEEVTTSKPSEETSTPKPSEEETTSKPSEETSTSKPSEEQSTSDNPVVKYGDVDGDGVINVKDGVIIKKHLAQMDVTINEVNSDVNCDNTVDIQDAILLMKHLAQMDVILGPKK